MKVTRNIVLLIVFSTLFIQCKKDDNYLHQSDWISKSFADWTLSDANTRMTTSFSAPELTAERMNKSNISVYLRMDRK